MEEEGEGFCEQQKWNQEIGPKVLNSHPRLLICPECTLLPKVTFFFFDGEGMLVYSGEAQLATIHVIANTELIIVTFLICVQSEEPHDLIYSISNVRNTTRSLQWKCSGICIFFLCRCSQLKVFSDIKWIREQII